ncbi:DUF6644 family protein [Xylophilus sp. GOD-11R]|uniref:DUF6644 family protein n=1 Tax=Xylophilus sp. GOD-11R TaxID=3089814 RepID=UPI00298C81BC|nr:DUF6644 family protein [Xylophilus sp. GOD-11R]WPB57483.1 DUF6644 family protein [Xylophilus sp. GOD-11R]
MNDAAPWLAPVLTALQSWPGSLWLQRSGTAYLLVNAAHILGLGLLFGSIALLDGRLLRARVGADLPWLARSVPRVAGAGLALAVTTGLWLFSVRPQEYLGNAAFVVKMGLLSLAIVNVAWQHRSAHWSRLEAGAVLPAAVRLRAAASLLLWTGVVVAGRWIGFL